MGAISSIISRFTGGSRRGGAGRSTGATRGTTGGAQSQDAKIGRAVRTAVKKATGKR